ncbi:MAG: hypothetical protein GX605_06750, partial [Chloroflexi bacterium]|nr:hypothetical protein [Chloroflexota bacterium]
QDSLHQEAAANLIAWLMEPPRNAAWNASLNLLPTRREALALLNNDDPYMSFLHWQLESARFRPHAPAYHTIAQALQTAVREVLSGEASPEESARRALKAVGQTPG